jgi:peptidyl-tRNA hydrolase
MDLAAESVDLRCLAGVAGLAVLLQLAKEVELADFQRLAEGVGRAGSQRSVEEARLAGFVMVAELLVEQSLILQSLHSTPEGIPD